MNWLMRVFFGPLHLFRLGRVLLHAPDDFMEEGYRLMGGCGLGLAEGRRPVSTRPL